MASFGARRPRFAPHEGTQPTDALPAFGEPVTIGRLVSANMTVTLATGELFADDVLAESVSEFASADVAMETDDMVDDVASVVYGATVDAGQVEYKAGDTPPTGGLAYIKVLMRNQEKFFKGFFYPNAKAAVGNDTAQTKGSSITFGTTATAFKIMTWVPTDDWRITKEFTTEAEAIAWCDEMLGVTGTP